MNFQNKKNVIDIDLSRVNTLAIDFDITSKIQKQKPNIMEIVKWWNEKRGNTEIKTKIWNK